MFFVIDSVYLFRNGMLMCILILIVFWEAWIFVHCWWPNGNYCRDNSKLCSCGGDRQIFYWDVTSGRVIRKFRGHDSEVSSQLTTFSLLVWNIEDFLLDVSLGHLRWWGWPVMMFLWWYWSGLRVEERPCSIVIIFYWTMYSIYCLSMSSC